ncbi:MAG: hypothetical protein ACLSA6_18850 [Holdemania massiliensis]
MFEGLLSLIEQSEVDTLYRHINPDCDALGSQWGLATWLKHRFPLKRVYVLGQQKMTNGLFEDSDVVDDETVRIRWRLYWIRLTFAGLTMNAGKAPDDCAS